MPLETQFPHLLKGTGYASWPDLPKCPNGVQLKFNKQTGTSRQWGKPCLCHMPTSGKAGSGPPTFKRWGLREVKSFV